MKLTVLGSAASEGFPGIFCACDVCREAWARGGRDIRLRTAYALGSTVRIDLGPDAMAQDHRHGLRAVDIRHLVFTHSHRDHLYVDYLDYRTPGSSVVSKTEWLRVYGDPRVMAVLRAALGEKLDVCRLELVPLSYFTPVEIPDEDMTLHPLRANHFEGGEAMIHLFVRRGRRLLIANDTGYFPDDTWEYLERRNDKPLDLAILDCTLGQKPLRNFHMGRDTVLEVVERLRASGLAGSATRFAVNHFSHNGAMLHDELEAFFRPYGVDVCHDGRVFQL